MDRETLIHLETWLHRQFPYTATADDETQSTKALMLAQYATDPEHYDRAGWWCCYDDAREE